MSESTARWDPAAGRTEVMTEAGFGPPVNWSKFEVYRKQVPVFVKKNKGLLLDGDFWKLLPQMRKLRAGMKGADQAGPTLFVSTHHKAMTTYFNAVLNFFAYATARPFEKINTNQPKPESRMFLSNHGKFDLDAIRPYRGVHLMRDPRDMIVSGYHYHRWTYETWVHRPDDNGLSYQQKLKAADRTTGLFMEIDHFLFFYRELLENWNMDDPDMLEVSYESLMGEGRDDLYGKIFGHFGCEGDELQMGIDLMRLFEAKRRTGRGKGNDAAKAKHSHIRSGRSEQWRQELEPQHLAYIEAQLGPVLRKFGYDPA